MGDDGLTARHSSPTAERALAGLLAMLEGDQVVDKLIDRLPADDLTDKAARAVFWAAAELRSAGAPVSRIAMTERLRAAGRLSDVGGEHGIDELTADATTIASAKQLIADVKSLARWRRRDQAVHALGEAAVIADEDEWARAEHQLQEIDRPATGGGYIAGHELLNRLTESLQGGDPTRWPWPLPQLNQITSGGARPGQMTGIFGPSSHGKSAFLDNTLLAMENAGANCLLYLNEMTADERAERIASNLTGIPYSHLQLATAGRRPISKSEWSRIMDRMQDMRLGMVEAPDWTVDEILRDARRRKPQVLALDIVQKLPTRPFDRRLEMLEDAVQRLDAFAKDTGCHVLYVGQVNRQRADGVFPMPGMGDVKDCAELVNGPDNVLFVWRKQDKRTLKMQAEGIIRIAKYRGASTASVNVYFDGDRQRWVEQGTFLGGAVA